MPTLVYILAASHSGSTLLAMLLGAHPQAVTVGEIKATSLGDVDRYRCSCGELIRRCGFWRSVATRMSSRGHTFDVTNAQTNVLDVQSSYAAPLLRPLHRGRVLEAVRDALLALSTQWRRHLAHTQTRNLALIETLAELSGASVVVDSSKVGLRLKYLLRMPSLDVRVVRLIRDGRGVALTYTNPGEFADARDVAQRRGGAGADDSGDPSALDMTRAAREWRRSNEEAETLVARLPRDKWLEVRYEDLCHSPERTLRRICTFVGISVDSMVIDFRSREQHVVGNGMRLDRTSVVSLDERWRTTLDEKQLRVFDSVAGELNRKYGYA